MKIALKNQSVVKIFNGDLKYEDILAFASKEFNILAQSCCLTYSDDEGDEITICSTEDFNVLVDLYKKKSLVKINVKTSDSKESIQITDQSEYLLKDSFEKLSEKTKKEEDLVREGPATDNDCSGNQKKQIQSQPQLPHKQRHQHGWGFGHKGHHWHRGDHGHHEHHGHKGHRNSDSSSSHEQRHFHKFHRMQNFMNQKIAHQVDERIKVLLPCLQNQINPQNPIKLFSVLSSLVHPSTQCKGCYAAPITGIRYKCLRCPEFSLCEKCEANVEHPHNLLKMKFVQENQDKQKPFHCFQRWGKHISRGYTSSSSRSHSKSKESEFWAKKKASKLAKIFGGESKDYKEFVSTNKDLHIDETIAKFAKENNRDFSGFKGCKFNKAMQKLISFFGLSKQQAQKYVDQNQNLRGRELVQMYAKENSISQQELKKKRINFKCQKLGILFEKDPQSFKQFVSSNLDLRLYQLKRLFMEQNFSGGFHHPWGFRHQNKKSSPFLKKQGQKFSEQKRKKSGDKRQRRGNYQEYKRRDKSLKKENLQKSGILKVMVQYFGTQNIDEYYKLIDEHFSEGQEKITQIYIQNHAE